MKDEVDSESPVWLSPVSSVAVGEDVKDEDVKDEDVKDEDVKDEDACPLWASPVSIMKIEDEETEDMGSDEETEEMESDVEMQDEAEDILRCPGCDEMMKEDVQRCPAVCPECSDGQCRHLRYHEVVGIAHQCDLCGYSDDRKMPWD